MPLDHQDRSTRLQRIALAAIVLTPMMAQAADEVPRLVRTTSPIRISKESVDARSQPAPIPFSMPEAKAAWCGQPTSSEKTPAVEFRSMISPDVPFGFDRATGEIASVGRGKTRVNRFVGFRTQPSDRQSSDASNSLTITHQPSHPGVVKTNPLVVDSPPKLRRFSADEPLIQSSRMQSDVLTAVEKETGLRVARDGRPPARDISDFDKELDALSLAPEPKTSLHVAARDGGFGMMAIDQIGGHLPKAPSTADAPDGAEEANSYVARRFPNDSVAQSESLRQREDSFRDQLSAFELIGVDEEELPQLPSPDRSGTLDQPKQDAAVTKTAPPQQVFDPLPSPYRSSDTTQAPREIEDLVRSIPSPSPRPEQAQELKLPKKPTLTDRFSAWANRIKGAPKEETVDVVSKAAKTNLSDKARAKTTQSKRSTGLLNRLFKK